MTQIKTPAPRQPLIDERTKQISREWHLYLLSLTQQSDQSAVTLTELEPTIAVIQVRLGVLDVTVVTLQSGIDTLNEDLTNLTDEVALKELLSNKVIVISGTSTDDEYPSAKLLYDSLETKEALLPETPLLPAAKVLDGNRTWAEKYAAADGSAGISTTITTANLVGKTITVKDGLITGFA